MICVAYIPTGGLSLGLVSDLSPRRVTVARIQRAVATFYNLPLRIMRTPIRVYNDERHVAMFIARRDTGKSYQDIANRFGRGDHTTVIHAERKIARMCAENPAFASEVNEIRQRLAA